MSEQLDELKSKKAALLAQLDAIDTELCKHDPLMNPARFMKRPGKPQYEGDPGICIDMTGQPQKCEECGATYYRRGAYLFCKRDKENHWRFIDGSSEQVLQALAERWGDPT